MPDEYRPNPDDILKRLNQAKKDESRGRLKLFFGMCPGVGKTYAMLLAAQELKRAGIAVAVGVVETHGREDTKKLLQGLEIYPLQKIEYKGTTVSEMDLDFILHQRPAVVLVDELAHTNAPGCRHPKRYQDVNEILNAGMDVYATLNVQHVESRADLVHKITGVAIRETVPDSIIEQADQIQLVDISPRELLKRLEQGKVYLGARAEQAAQNFFKEENLTALREISLRFTAEKVDEELKGQMTVKGIVGPWNTNERLLVAISQSPYSARLIRATRRMAYSLEAPWIALYVDTGLQLSPADQTMVNKNLNLAKELGAEVITTVDTRVLSALRRVAQEKNVTQIVMGRPDRRFFRDLWARGTILDQLVRETSEIDIHVIRQERKPIFRGFRLVMPRFSSGPLAYWYTLWILLATALLGFFLIPYVGYKAIGFLFLGAVVVAASFAGRGPILFSAIFSALVWDYFFIPPIFTFVIRDFEDLMMCLSYFIVAIVLGFLTTRIRRQEEHLVQREARANFLYELTRQLSTVRGERDITTVVARAIERLFQWPVSILLKVSNQQLSEKPTNVLGRLLNSHEMAVAQWSFDQGRPAGCGTDTLNSSNCLCLPIRGQKEVQGVMVVFPKKAARTLEQDNILQMSALHLAMTIERERLEQTAQRAHLLEESEKLHQALLDSVSHELRTPLTSIIGAASTLASAHEKSIEKPLLDEIMNSSQRLNRVIENLLDMSRLTSAGLQIHQTLLDLNDLISSILRRHKNIFHRHALQINLETVPLFVLADERLLEHALLNVFINATLYAPAETTILIKSYSSDHRAVVSVRDEGPGVEGQHLPHIFEKFYRIPGTPAGGTGLGLSIVKTIFTAHGGWVRANNNDNGHGLTVFLILPQEQGMSDADAKNSDH